MSSKESHLSILQRLQRWWQGDADPAARAEARRIRDERDIVKASVPGFSQVITRPTGATSPNVHGGMHQRGRDERPS